MFLSGLLLIAIGITGRVVRWHGYHISQLERICSSPIGQLGQAVSTRVHTDCSLVSGLDFASWLAIFVGAVLAIIALYRYLRGAQ